MRTSTLVCTLLAVAITTTTGAGAAVVELGRWDSPGPVYDIALSGDVAYLTRREDGMIVLDISDPATPTVLSQVTPGGSNYGVTVAGGLVYLTSDDGRLRVLDVSDPTAPMVIGQVDLDIAGMVVVQGHLAYVTCSYMGLKMVDVSDPTSPVQVGHYDAPADLFAIHVAVGEEFVYVTHSDLGGYPIFIMDVSDPGAPERVGWIYTVISDASAARDGYLFTTDDGGLFITDVSDPAAPVRVGVVDIGWGEDIALHGDHAFVADWEDGLRVAEISDVTAPGPVSTFAIGQHGRAVAVDAERVLLSGWDHSLWILALEPETPVGDHVPGLASPALTVHPNPFNPRTSLTVTMPDAGLADLKIHDLRGRRVRTLLDGHRAAGTHVINWDGADQQGRMLPAGTYLAVLRTTAGHAAARLSLVK